MFEFSSFGFISRFCLFLEISALPFATLTAIIPYAAMATSSTIGSYESKGTKKQEDRNATQEKVSQYLNIMLENYGKREHEWKMSQHNEKQNDFSPMSHRTAVTLQPITMPNRLSVKERLGSRGDPKYRLGSRNLKANQYLQEWREGFGEIDEIKLQKRIARFNDSLPSPKKPRSMNYGQLKNGSEHYDCFGNSSGKPAKQ